jgi:ABC-type Fe3+-hydroxamate transport system substrate-binding protein
MAYRPVISFCLCICFAILSYQGCGRKTPFNENISGKRIISLSPSITGQIIDLGAEENIAGVTPYHPPLKRDVPLVGTYISPSIEKIISLKPDIILMSEEDGEIQRDSFFEKFGLKYYRFGRNSDFQSICANYSFLGEMIGRKDSASEKIKHYRQRLNSVKKVRTPLKVVFLVSVKPLITVSKLSHISDIIKEAGGENVFAYLDNPYPILTLESLIIKKPDVVLIMSPGEDQYLYRQLEKFKNIDFINRKNIFVTGDGIIPYYSPKEFVLSVEKISEILSHVNK